MITKKVMISLFFIVGLMSTSIVFASSSENENRESELSDIPSQPTKWDVYENNDYGVIMQYPNNWIKFEGDIAPGDYVTNIVTFKAPFDTSDEEIETGDNSERELRGHQYIRFAIYHPPIPLSKAQHDLDLYLQEQLNSYGQDKNEQIFDYSSRNTFLGGPQHPAFYVHLTFETGDYEMEQYRTGTIIDGNVYYIDYTVFPENYENNFSIFQKMLDSLEFK